MKRLFSLFTIVLLVLYLAMPVFAADVSVTYKGAEVGIVFEPKATDAHPDLFPEFKDVMPGDTFLQEITIINESTVINAVHLRALSVDRDPLSLEFLSLLSLTVDIDQQNGDRNVFEAAADKIEGLEDWNLLGIIYPHGEIKLNVTLKVSPEMDNRFQNVSGAVEWEFMFEERISTIVVPSDPVGPGGTPGSSGKPTHSHCPGCPLDIHIITSEPHCPHCVGEPYCPGKYDDGGETDETHCPTCNNPEHEHTADEHCPGCTCEIPNVPGGTDDPNAPGGTDDPDAPGGTDDPNVPGGTDDPNAPGGTDDPNAPGGTDDPNVPGGTDDPDVPGGTDDPDVPGGTDDPNAPGGTEDPDVPGGTEDPDVPGGTDDPDVPGGTEDPDVPGGTDDPDAPVTPPTGDLPTLPILYGIAALSLAAIIIILIILTKKSKKDKEKSEQ